MFQKISVLKVFPFILCLAAFLTFTGCAATSSVSQVPKADVWGSPETGLNLTYRGTAGQILIYSMVGEQTETTEIQGQIIEAQTESNAQFTFAAKPAVEGNVIYTVTVDSMDLNIQSNQGELSPDMTPVVGKSFDMTLSPLGEELDISGAKAIEFEMVGAGKRNLASRFQAYFPNLPPNPVKIGDTWTTSDTIDEGSDDISIEIQLENLNTVDGFETVDDVECVRIKTQVSGAVTGHGNQQGVDLTIDGDYTGEDIWYFDYKTGVLVKYSSEGVVDGVIAAGPPANMDIPMTQKMSQEMSLVK